jgi:hypothetical protein
MKSWKTTLGGVLGAAGLSMQTSADKTVQIVGWILAAVGTLLLGASAKDSNVTGGNKKQ